MRNRKFGELTGDEIAEIQVDHMVKEGSLAEELRRRARGYGPLFAAILNRAADNVEAVKR